MSRKLEPALTAVKPSALDPIDHLGFWAAKIDFLNTVLVDGRGHQVELGAEATMGLVCILQDMKGEIEKVRDQIHAIEMAGIGAAA